MKCPHCKERVDKVKLERIEARKENTVEAVFPMIVYTCPHCSVMLAPLQPDFAKTSH